ncbi:MAG: CinA family nicotinamide mononucleotide deamidase-related protein [Candidatus Hydrogenedens sp.]|jgi:nicotinamide-nucleotide amidase|nr:CinA family nicotinamide mononucleotide deamidase-related protein [Candidatus Hydrogenedens sp.]
MQAEIISIGTELLLGQIVDTNATYMAAALAEKGIPLYWKTTVGDNAERLEEALRRGLERSDALLCCGGLGPTGDDITRDCVARVLGRPLKFHPELYEKIEERMHAYRRGPIPENNKRQACLPEKALSMPNSCGTAPGLIAEKNNKLILCMPGVPSEFKAMLDNTALPYLCEYFNIHQTIVHQTLLVRTLGESRVDALIADLMEKASNPTIGLLASKGRVQIRMTACAPDKAAAFALIKPLEETIRHRLEPYEANLGVK